MLGDDYSEQVRESMWVERSIMQDWIHDWIWDWNRKWDPVLMVSTVQPNWRHEIIAILSGGMAGNVFEPIWGNQIKVSKPPLVTKGAGLGYSTLTVFGGSQYDCLPYFQWSDHHPAKAPPNTGYNWSQLSYN